MELQAHDEEAILELAVACLDDRFASIEPSRIEGTARRIVHERFERSRVKNFVGIIAERHARTALQQSVLEEFGGSRRCPRAFRRGIVSGTLSLRRC
jgi:hypothetical protein